MMRDYWILGMLMILATLGVSLSVYKEMRPEYIAYQKQYYELTGVKQYEYEIKQLNFNTDSGILIDRCMTCHLGATNPAASHFPVPLNFHKAIVSDNQDHHNFDKIGCVVCHDGNGRGLGKVDAHGDYHDWHSPILKGKMVQANCSRCHETTVNDLAGAVNFNRGKKLYFARACWACHTIMGLSSGKSAPDLTDAGAKFSVEYLKESIVDPTANSSISKMPKFSWVTRTDDVNDLTIFLKGQRANRLKDNKKAPVEYKRADLDFLNITSSSASLGKEIFWGISKDGINTRGGCINCHSIRNDKGELQGGHNAPELTFVARSRTKAFIIEHIKNPKKHVPDTIMPSFASLSDQAIDSLYKFLDSFEFSLTGEEKYSDIHIYKTYCSGCHGEKLDGRGPRYALLDPLPRDFTKFQFIKSYQERFASSIKKGVPGTAMSSWENVLDEKQIHLVKNYIIKMAGALKDSYKRLNIELPSVNAKDRKPPYAALVPGDFQKGKIVFQRYCTSCHGKLANGKGPNAYFLVHPLPRNLLNTEFMNQPAVDDKRLYQSIMLGVAGTSMPPHDFLPDQSILDLIEYIKQLNKVQE
ncbi:MAG: hypothetical protein A2381_02090 [Bdellovibrionales bacterium RIFOXYB1_FULL_37_110]|nr:MAG: hypothetical protein A2417_13395 [Bdellovibrionales bacterium RIFOXYC1_FULL_37_79]OFZ59230.1 MAG: hypothetical protein A2381_02090 [Bdellovibrionales bacterium RIFOXYB1_FULL_37_110]OFZ62856.1 MAG: hypothetical protein A2577_11045 [Bdellovibrionales bacterium RIFOXYD1_FULL_36_51]